LDSLDGVSRVGGEQTSGFLLIGFAALLASRYVTRTGPNQAIVPSRLTALIG
jgi:hypothetical protein